MIKRGFDISVAVALLVLTTPLFLFAWIGIKLSSPGPVLYHAKRIGLHGAPFSMLKFRTMHTHGGGAVISAKNDIRIFKFGALLRRLKIDELPQFFNVLIGQMAMVGPRPEDPEIVKKAYNSWMRETLDIRPGITSPGTLFYFAVGEQLIDADNPEGSYISGIMPLKLALDRAYIDRATLLSDIATIFRTVAVIIGIAIGKPIPVSPRDIEAAQNWVPQQAFEKLL